MKFRRMELYVAMLIGVVVPAVVFSAINPTSKTENSPTNSTDGTQLSQTQQTQWQIPVIMEDGSQEYMELDTYLLGVLLGEIPADFDMEAQKAQAVVARTYALRQYLFGTKHSGNGVCTDSACCQSYCSADAYIAAGGTWEDVERMTQAVSQTQGQVLIYEGQLIEATYFSCSGGRTEDAQAVWGNDVPYLQSTDSPGEEGAEHYTDTVILSSGEFLAALDLELPGIPADWIGSVSYTEGNGVDTMQIGDRVFSGTQLRQALGLRSTMFTMTVVGDSIVITTRGFGHRVGMSQYGAEAMAVQGSTFDEILAHYYQGTELMVY